MTQWKLFIKNKWGTKTVILVHDLIMGATYFGLIYGTPGTTRTAPLCNSSHLADGDGQSEREREMERESDRKIDGARGRERGGEP